VSGWRPLGKVISAMFELSGSGAVMSPACKRGLIWPLALMFYAQTDPYHLSRFDALYATTGPSVRAGHSACAFTSLLRHAANFCASWAVRV